MSLSCVWLVRGGQDLTHAQNQDWFEIFLLCFGSASFYNGSGSRYFVNKIIDCERGDS